MQKGQIAHLDQNNENADEDNLVFLCLDHHDEYDGKTSQSKGLKENEVRHYRDELYNEMEYRFRTRKQTGFEMTVLGPVWIGSPDNFTVRFRLKNTGETVARNPIVSLRLPENVSAEVPKRNEHCQTSSPFGIVALEPPDVPDFWGMYEAHEDFFEPNGRVGMIEPVGGVHASLPPDHSTTFNGLGIRMCDFGPGTVIELEYRVDAEEWVPVLGKIAVTVPSRVEDFIPDDDC